MATNSHWITYSPVVLLNPLYYIPPHLAQLFASEEGGSMISANGGNNRHGVTCEKTTVMTQLTYYSLFQPQKWKVNLVTRQFSTFYPDKKPQITKFNILQLTLNKGNLTADKQTTEIL